MENPYINAGYTTVDPQSALAGNTAALSGGSPYLTAATANMPPSVVTENWLQQTPGYQWQLGQGLKATQSAAAARGLGVSGASLKGAATYATELADQTFEERYNDALKTASMGANAAALTGQQGTAAAATAGNYLNQAGVATAARTMAGPNALTSGLQSYLTYNALKDYLGRNPGTGGYQGSPGGGLPFA